jgi:hypothetical protein
MKQIVTLITHSLGEVDVLLPIFSAIRAKSSIEITCVFVVRTIHKQYLNSDFYQFCFRKLDITVKFKWLPNKFDYLSRKLLQNRAFCRIFLTFCKISSPLHHIQLKSLSGPNTIFLHEFTNQQLSTRILYEARKRHQNRILVYDHGHAVRLCQPSSIGRILDTDQVTLLLFHEHNRDSFEKKGFLKQQVIGYPKFFDEWIQTVRSYHKRLETQAAAATLAQKRAVIFSRPIHEYYMDEDIYHYLLATSITTIRRLLKDVLIIIKPHPREDITLLKKIITQKKFSNVEVSTEHIAVLSLDALFAISFWGSSILDPLILGVPAVEYYIEAKRFREAEPRGSSYRELGIDSVSTPEDLNFFINRVLGNNYQIPRIISELRKEASSVCIEKALDLEISE